jgi:hypothetical protein
MRPTHQTTGGQALGGCSVHWTHETTTEGPISGRTWLPGRRFERWAQDRHRVARDCELNGRHDAT